MAEPIGLGIGFVSLVFPVVENVKRLRDAYKLTGALPARLDDLTAELNFLLTIAGYMDHAAAPTIRDKLVTDHCKSSIDKVAAELDRLTQDAAKVKAARGLGVVVRKVSLARSCEDSLDELNRLVNSAKQDLLCACAILPQFNTEPKTPPDGGLVERTDGADNDASTTASRLALAQRRGEYWPSRRAKKCVMRSCPCRCHTEASLSSRFWALKYTPLSIVLGGCDEARCNSSTYTASFRIAFSQFGLKWAVIAALGVQRGNAGYSITTSLQPQHIVRFTSEGFVLLHKIVQGFINLDDGISSFRALYRRDPGLIYHVNPEGRGYIEMLVGCNPFVFDKKKALLYLFIQEFGMTQGLDSNRLLYACLRLIGDGPHLALFETLFELGLDPLALEGPRAALWPEPQPNWVCEDLTLDPFFIKLISKFVSIDHEYGNSSKIQYQILCDPEQALSSLRDPMHQLDLTPNFLSQSPLHLSVHHHEVVLALLEAGHPTDMPDLHGITPLMYAASLGLVQSAKHIIHAGADTMMEDSLFGRDFLSYAIAHKQWEFILTIATFFKKIGSQMSAYFGQMTLSSLASIWNSGEVSTGYIEALASLAEDVNFLFCDDRRRTESYPSGTINHLLHYSWSPETIEVIMSHGFGGINQANHIGQTALMGAAARGEFQIVQYYIDKGADVNQQDSRGITALSYALGGMCSLLFGPSEFRDDISYPKTVKILIIGGASLYSSDACKCPCSASGCTVANVLPPHFWVGRFSRLKGHHIFGTVELLHILQDCEKTADMKNQLISVIRRTRFRELGLVHTCCPKRRHLSYWCRWREVSLWEDMTFSEPKSMEAQDEHTGASSLLEQEAQGLENSTIEELMLKWQKQVYECLASDMMRKTNLPWKEVLRKCYEYYTQPEEQYPKDLVQSDPFTIDEKNDCIERPAIDISSWDNDFYMSPFSGLVEYMVNIEKSFLLFERDMNGPDKGAWYTRRITWAIQLADAMEIPPHYLLAGMKWCVGSHRNPSTVNQISHADSVVIMKHFLETRKAMRENKD
ncbi:hypothetical protein B0I35DRAFT_442370 [Stachybotrys elegans]|uniref:Fungal N-terminal domain-containing protein n=1 Tax=Stachybotrys elegans TaxID=80388 RepID=A0A8K0SI21_9HYPO|nr:hypothetical protein B0I35DRAFT_442370 [Stachybotrys elegans]